jgi:hypothetical protein
VAQLSPPFRIALVALLGVVAVWFTVLRPKPVESTPAPATPVPAKSVDSAAGSAAKPSPDAQARAAAEAKARRTDVAGIAEGDRSKPLVRALNDGRVVVLLFWNKAAADDRAVRRVVARTHRHDGEVVVKAADVRDVGRYGAITTGAQVLASPTALVIGPDRSARPIVGYTTSAELDDAVGDALATRR